MNSNNVIINIEVEIGYTTYTFDDVDFANQFCKWAAASIDDDYKHHISMKVNYIKKEGESDE